MCFKHPTPGCPHSARAYKAEIGDNGSVRYPDPLPCIYWPEQADVILSDVNKV